MVPGKLMKNENIPLDDQMRHIDIKCGYTQHQNIDEQYRMGFAYITDFRYVSDVQFTITNNGLYRCDLEFTPVNIKYRAFIT